MAYLVVILNMHHVKMKKLLFCIGSILYFLLTMPACMDEDFSTNPMHTLSFSKDTLSFDTLFTGQPSADKKLMIYNPNKKAVNIQSIYFSQGSNSNFLMNVDGMSGNLIQDIDLYSRDSLFVQIRVSPKEVNQDRPTFITDSLVIITNGVKQYIHLQVYGQDAWKWKGKIISQDTTLTSQRPFIIYDSLVIAEGATLTIKEGVQLHFHANAEFQVKGTIQSKGKLNSPVVLRGDRLDKQFENLPYDYLAGQWKGVKLYHSSKNNIFEHTFIRSGEYGICADSSDLTHPKATISNSIIHNVRGTALQATNCQISVNNSQLSNAKDYCVYLMGGDYQFIHCTIANYYAWDIRKKKSVSINNYKEIEKNKVRHYPIINAKFQNTIIYGNHLYELELNNKYNKQEVNTDFNYHFQYCLLKFKKEENDAFVEIVWNKDPLFKELGDNNYVFDFRIDSLSNAIDQADYSISALYPNDLEGKNRLSDNNPDIGAYEFYPHPLK